MWKAIDSSRICPVLSLNLVLIFVFFASFSKAVSETYAPTCEGDTPWDPELGLDSPFVNNQYETSQELCEEYGQCRCKQTLNNPVVQVECTQRYVTTSGRNGRPGTQRAMRLESYLQYCEATCKCDSKLGKVAVKKAKEVKSKFMSLISPKRLFKEDSQCNWQCRRNYDCTTGYKRRSGCPKDDYICLASDRRSSSAWVGALCVAPLDFGLTSWASLGKRDADSSSGQRVGDSHDMACPCNATYVSKACCWAKDSGIVFEDPAMKLGHLAGAL